MNPLLRHHGHAVCAAALAAALGAPSANAANADVLLDWNERGIALVEAAQQSPPDSARTMAMMHLAMFDAANAIEPRYAFHDDTGAAPAGIDSTASSDAAIAAAARSVLVALFPTHRAALDRGWANWLERFGDQRGVEAGIALGERAAMRCIQMRIDDGVAAPNSYRPVTAAGVYISPGLPASFDWRQVKPWFLSSPGQFRPEPPPALNGPQWARDYVEIAQMGRRVDSRRTERQTETARFWAATGAPTWNSIVRALVLAHSRDRLQSARVFALSHMAAMDAFIAVFDAKYAYNFWRPITAIRNGDIDGNDRTVTDVTWLPLIDTPPHPEYPCAHCISAAAVAAVLEAEFGVGRVGPIAMTSPTAPGVTHRFDRIADYVSEVNQARIWAGVHFRTSTEIGERMGRAIGELVVRNGLRPRR